MGPVQDALRICCWIAASGWASAQRGAGAGGVLAAPAPSVWNTGLVEHFGIEPLVAGARVVPVLFEQNNGDRNGDGDALDQVCAVLDWRVRTILEPGVAIAYVPLLVDAGILLLVPEAGQGSADRNGDGDALDIVLHYHDLGLGTTRNLGLATWIPVVRGSVAAFLVSEASQGHADLNGDGDALDQILHVFDAATGSLTSWGLACVSGSVQVEDGFVTALVSERDQGGSSLNPDRDDRDRVAHVIDLGRGTVRNLRLASDYDAGRMQGKKLVFRVLESAQGVDLDGDGRLLDGILFEHDPERGLTVNRKLRIDPLRHFDASPWLEVPSFEGGRIDLNGDGDLHDQVDLVRSPLTERLEFLGADFALVRAQGERAIGFHLQGFTAFPAVVDLPTGQRIVASEPFQFLQEGPDGPLVNADTLVYPASEFRARTDFNSDGDLLDAVPCLLDQTSGESLRLTSPLSSYCGDLYCEYEYFTYAASERVVAYSFDEQDDGARDRNGDGDALDWILQAVHVDPLALGQSLQHGPIATVPAGTVPLVAERWIAWAGYGNGTPGLDSEAQLFDAASGARHDLELEAEPRLLTGQVLALDVFEAAEGDLNGDGDALDRVLHLVVLP